MRQFAWGALAARLVLGAVMLWAGLAKVADLRASDAAVSAYGLVSPEAARIIGGALPCTEIAVGVLLLAGAATRLAALLTAGLMSVYIAAIASAWARGLSIDCGCFGGGGAVSHGAQSGYAIDIARDALLLSAAVFLVRWPRSRYGLDQLLVRAEARGTREADAVVEEMVLRGQRRQRGRLVSVAAAAVIVVAAIGGIGAMEASAAVPAHPPAQVPAGATSDKAGVALSAGPVRVDIYLDYLCPECRIAEASFAPVLAKMKEEHEISLVYHPLGFLDSYSDPAGYSSRAAAAAACAADQGKLSRYTQALYARQPAERGPGLGTSELIAAGRDAGIVNPAFSTCVRSGKYAAWVRYASDVAFAKDISVTPAVFVNGQQVDVSDADPGAALRQAVAAAAK